MINPSTIFLIVNNFFFSSPLKQICLKYDANSRLFLIDSGIHLLSYSNIPSCRATELVWKISVKIRPIAAPTKLRAKTTFAPVVIRASQGPQQQGPVRSRHHIAACRVKKTSSRVRFLNSFLIRLIPKKLF